MKKVFKAKPIKRVTLTIQKLYTKGGIISLLLFLREKLFLSYTYTYRRDKKITEYLMRILKILNQPLTSKYYTCAAVWLDITLDTATGPQLVREYFIHV